MYLKLQTTGNCRKLVAKPGRCIRGIFERGQGVEFAEKGKSGAILMQSKGEIEEEEYNGSAGSGGRLTNYAR